MARVCIVGGGSALAQPYIARCLARGDEVWAVCRNTFPRHEVRVIRDDMAGNCSTFRTKCPEPLDLLVALAGSTGDALLGTAEAGASWDRVVNNTLTAAFNSLNIALPRMARPGNVVVVGSVVGSTGGYGCANYAAAKAGLVGLVRAAANEWARKGVCVNLLSLGYCDAGMGARLSPEVREKVTRTIPLGRFANPEEVADAIDFLGKVKYMSGDVLPFAGGLR